MDAIKRRRQALLDKTESTSYSKQKSSLEKELSRFLFNLRLTGILRWLLLMMLLIFLSGKIEPGKLWHMKKIVFISAKDPRVAAHVRSV